MHVGRMPAPRSPRAASMQHVTVLGAGGWGTALAVHLGRIGHEVSLWGRDPALVAEIAARRANAVYLPDVSLPESVTVTGSLPQALGASELVVSALPSHGCRAVLRAAAPIIAAARDRRERDERSRDRHAAADVGSDRAGARHGASGGRALGSELRGRGGPRTSDGGPCRVDIEAGHWTGPGGIPRAVLSPVRVAGRRRRRDRRGHEERHRDRRRSGRGTRAWDTTRWRR